MQEKAKLFAPPAAPATRHPEVDHQLHRLQQLMEENAAQQLLIHQKERDLRAAQIEIQELKGRQYIHPDAHAIWYTKTTKRRSPVKVGRQYVMTNLPSTYDDQHFHPTACQPEVINQLPQINAIEVFLEKALYDNLMRARDIGLRAMERGRPEKPLQDLSSTNYMVSKRKFKDAAKHEGLTQMNILAELPK